ncbi:hypothetical protein K438DRAFT_1765768 [Mycena galopus ATCC 62051]|nr:hypothetical protein K438DRAFT_1765768 [Mycena galopus ATCC 62051]
MGPQAVHITAGSRGRANVAAAAILVASQSPHPSGPRRASRIETLEEAGHRSRVRRVKAEAAALAEWEWNFKCAWYSQNQQERMLRIRGLHVLGGRMGERATVIADDGVLHGPERADGGGGFKISRRARQKGDGENGEVQIA